MALTGTHNAGDVGHVADHNLIDATLTTLTAALAAKASAASVTALGLAKLSVLTPEQFGAIGDGVVDDTAALVTAVTNASTQKKALVLTGAYKFSSIFLTLNDVTIEWRPGSRLVCSLSKTANTIPFELRGSRVRLYYPRLTFSTTLNIDVDAVNRPADADAIRLGGANSSSIVDVVEVFGGFVDYSRNSGLRIRYAKNVKVSGFRCFESLGNGVMLDTCQDSSVVDSTSRRSGDDAFVALAGSADYNAGLSRNITFRGNFAFDSYANGYNYTGVDGGIIDGNLADRTWAPGLRVWQDTTFALGSCKNITIGVNTIKRAGTYFGSGQYRTAATTIPFGVYILGGVTNVFLFPQNISDGQDKDVVISDGGVVNLRSPFLAPRAQSGNYLSTVGLVSATGTTLQDQLTFTSLTLGEKATTVSLQVNVTTAVAGTTIRLGIYTDSSSLPNALVGEAAVVDSSTTGVKTATLTVPLLSGNYWLAAVAQGGTPGVKVLTGKAVAVAGGADPGNDTAGYKQSGVSGALPAIATVNGVTSTPIALTVRI